jgi:hypothetical protein
VRRLFAAISSAYVARDKLVASPDATLPTSLSCARRAHYDPRRTDEASRPGRSKPLARSRGEDGFLSAHRRLSISWLGPAIGAQAAQVDSLVKT